MSSYWTKRRRIHARLAEHIEVINNARSASDVPADFPEDTVSDEDEVDCDVTIDASAQSEGEPAEENIWPDNIPNTTCGNSSDISNETSDEDESENILGNLSSWAIDFKIPQTALAGLLKILRPFHPELPKDPRTLLHTPRNYNIKSIAGGVYYHFGISSAVIRILENFNISELEGDVKLQVNIDGLPLFKSSSTQLWPILGRLTQPQVKTPFVIGIFCGNKKPSDVNEYLEDFVNEMMHIQSEGILTKSNSVINLALSCFVCDSPARAFIKKVKGHTGYYGCDNCVQKGCWLGKMTFPETESPVRTDVQFDEMEDLNHHLGQSPLAQLQVGMVTGFPLDYMHLVCLGVMRRLIWLWTKGPLHFKCRLGTFYTAKISEHILALRQYLPREFNRKGRSLIEVDRWKATEFRLFLLYTGPVVLYGKLRTELYHHFLLLFVGIYCLSSTALCNSHSEYAREILCLFVKDVGRLYGPDMLVYNIHNLVHLPSFVQKLGPLDNFSAFPFESFLGGIKKLVRQPKSPLQQIVRRMLERQTCPVLASKKRDGYLLKGTWNCGPLLDGYRTCTQFCEIEFPDFAVSLSQGDNCVIISGKVAILRNIVRTYNNECILLYEHFNCIENFFTYPLDSSKIGVKLVSALCGSIEEAPLSSLNCKCVCLPFSNKFVVLPILHLH